ncbi:hypothetical protein CKM354_000807700 [Cercospora kikuchii]|uniref:BTB domain-containing protein n=1 Tax=Cercospora kikuchii TaxID=84275 RepID=A0A9P3CKI4_9PEZI|nr:uncharacterized protein CKM354_000807700 [Cercospora kikuchii]GIZ44892.1 hypothetical protein CKM354_000807700 [Cercospora kikuchii]
MICHYSGFFRAAISWPHNLPITPEDSTIRLPFDSPDTFSRILSYCHHRTFVVTWNENPLHHLSYDDLIDLYSTALALDMPLIQNTTTDLFAQKIRGLRTLPDRWSIESLWRKSPPGIPLRALLIDLVVRCLSTTIKNTAPPFGILLLEAIVRHQRPCFYDTRIRDKRVWNPSERKKHEEG